AAERFVNLPAKLAWFAGGILGCGPIGPLSLCFPAWIYVAAVLVVLLGVVGLARLFRLQLPAWRGIGWRGAAGELSTAIWAGHGILIAGTLVAALGYGLTLENGWQGRYLFPAYSSLAVCLAAGLLAWRPARRRLFAGLVLLASLALS